MSDEPDYLTGSLVAGALLALLALVAAVWRVGPEERLVVRRSGRIRAVAGPGLRLIIPLLDRATRVSVRPLQADLWCRTGSRDDVFALARGRAVFEVSDLHRYASDPDAALVRACRAAEQVLCGHIASRELGDLSWPGGQSRTLAARVPETAGLTATELELLDLEIPLRHQPVRSPVPDPDPEEASWN